MHVCDYATVTVALPLRSPALAPAPGGRLRRGKDGRQLPRELDRLLAAAHGTTALRTPLPFSPSRLAGGDDADRALFQYSYAGANYAGHTKKVTMNAIVLISFCT